MYLYNTVVPTYGCDAITDDGTCFNYITSTGTNWENARILCTSRGYNLATVKSSQENNLLHAIRSSSRSDGCWIGLNDISSEGTFVWSDGSDNLYRNWIVGQPNNYHNQDCVRLHGNLEWSDLPCTHKPICFYCSTKGKNIRIIRDIRSSFLNFTNPSLALWLKYSGCRL